MRNSDHDEHPAEDGAPSPLQPSFTFLLLFALLFVAVTHYLGNMLPETALGWLMRSTAYLVVLFLKALGLSAVLDGIRVLLPGYVMKVNLECTAIHYLGIFVIGVLAYPFHRIPYKLFGAGAGAVLIVFLNVLRISVVGIIGMYSADLALFVHTYLWQGVFAVLVLFLWIFWTKGPAVPGMPAVRFAVTFLCASALTVLLLELAMTGYVELLASLAGLVARVVPCTADMRIAASGEMIEYVSGTRLYGYSIATDILDSAMFIALMAATPGMGGFARRAGLTAGGYAVLMLTHIAFVITIGSIVFTLAPAMLSNIFWVLRSVSVLIPIALWLVVRSIFRRDAGEIRQKHEV